jgi:hypothetical protein
VHWYIPRWLDILILHPWLILAIPALIWVGWTLWKRRKG